jgi:hypothetical protein
MTIPRLLFALTWVALSWAPASADDLTGIDRTIKKEPAYQSKTPRYCLLVLGPGGKTRVWLVVDGDKLYIDRNGNCDLTEKGECVKREEGEQVRFEAGDVLDADGKTKHTNVLVMQKKEKGQTITVVLAAVGGKYLFGAGLDSAGALQFGDKPENAPVIHFGGKLRMGLYTESGEPELIRSKNGEELRAWVGTPGLGKGTFAALVNEQSFLATLLGLPGGIPAGVHPVAEIEFPHRNADRPPLKATIALKERC